MQLVITNVSSPSIPIYVSDLMITIAPGATITCTRAESDLSRMVALQNYIAGGQLTMTVTPTLNEIQSGALGPIPRSSRSRSGMHRQQLLRTQLCTRRPL